MLPEPPEDKDSSPAGPARRPGPSRFLIPAGQRVADDHDSAVSAASFLSRDKIVGKLNIPSSPAAMSPKSSKPISEILQNGNVCPSPNAKSSEDGEEPKPKRGRGRPRKDRNSLPLIGKYLQQINAHCETVFAKMNITKVFNGKRKYAYSVENVSFR